MAVLDRDADPPRILVMAPAAALVMLPNRSPKKPPDDRVGAALLDL